MSHSTELLLNTLLRLEKGWRSLAVFISSLSWYIALKGTTGHGYFHTFIHIVKLKQGKICLSTLESSSKPLERSRNVDPLYTTYFCAEMVAFVELWISSAEGLPRNQALQY